jgi:hypothetical protein
MTDHVHTTARRAAAVLVTLLFAAVIPGIGPFGHIGRAHAAMATIAIFADASSLVAGGWHHVAMTVDPSPTVAYVDGIERNSIPGGFGQAGHGIQLGDPAFKGAIDEVRIYNRALTSTQVAPLAEQVPCANVTGIPVSECTALQARQHRRLRLDPSGRSSRATPPPSSTSASTSSPICRSSPATTEASAGWTDHRPPPGG